MSARLFFVLVSLLLAHCSTSDGAATNPGSTTAASSGAADRCASRCESKASACGAPDGASRCAKTCASLTESELSCIEGLSCSALATAESVPAQCKSAPAPASGGGSNGDACTCADRSPTAFGVCSGDGICADSLTCAFAAGSAGKGVCAGKVCCKGTTECDETAKEVLDARCASGESCADVGQQGTERRCLRRK